MSNKKISEVVIAMNEKIDSLHAMISNTDNNHKIILNKLNIILSKLETSGSAQLKQQEPVKANSDHDEYWTPKPGQKLPPTNKSNDVEELESEKPPSKNVKVSVSQQIMWPDGRPVFLAHVEIYETLHDTFGKPIPNLVRKTRTNVRGKWIGSLSPGNYSVRVIKRVSGDSTNPPVEIQYPIKIDESADNQVLTLQDFVIEEK